MRKLIIRPASIAGLAAVAVLASFPASAQSVSSSKSDTSVAELQKRPTPKLGGRPDFSGNWFSGTGTVPPLEFQTQRGADGSIEMKMAATKANGDKFKEQFDPTAVVQPKYKPGLEVKAAENFKHLSTTDKAYSCGQPGLPRIGAPQKITQTPKELIFLYADIAGMVWRVVPFVANSSAATKFLAEKSDNEPSDYGEGVAFWDGSTLVVQSKNFAEDTWFGEFGYYHSPSMTVTERFTRAGDTVGYDVTVTDPEVLLSPWVKPHQVLTKAAAEILQPPACYIEPNLEGPPTEGGYHAQRF